MGMSPHSMNTDNTSGLACLACSSCLSFGPGICPAAGCGVQSGTPFSLVLGAMLPEVSVPLPACIACMMICPSALGSWAFVLISTHALAGICLKINSLYVRQTCKCVAFCFHSVLASYTQTCFKQQLNCSCVAMVGTV